MKDKRNRHGAVGKSSSEQHFRKSAAISYLYCVAHMCTHILNEISPVLLRGTVAGSSSSFLSLTLSHDPFCESTCSKTATTLTL